MKINVFTIVWNEEFMLPKFLEHYSQYADRIIVADHHSDDLTAEIAKAHPMVTYLTYDYPTYNEREISNTFVKLSKEYPADWAICVDADEFIHNIPALEFEDPGVLKTQGYMMVGKTGKLEDCKKIRFKGFDKPVVFDPSLNVRFGDGRHTVNLPTRESVLELWHYKYPSREYYIERNTAAYPRIMDAAMMDYRLKRGLGWYDRHI